MSGRIAGFVVGGMAWLCMSCEAGGRGGEVVWEVVVWEVVVVVGWGMDGGDGWGGWMGSGSGGGVGDWGAEWVGEMGFGWRGDTEVSVGGDGSVFVALWRQRAGLLMSGTVYVVDLLDDVLHK